MSHFDSHCKDCSKILGNAWEEVHRFLDQYTSIFPVQMFLAYHRSFLHNSYGLEIIKARWGYEAYKAGCIHLLADYHESQMISKGWKFIEANLPTVLIFFNNFNDSDPMIKPAIMQGWNGKGLVYLAMGEKMDKSDQMKVANVLVRTIKGKGYEAFIVGGTVRDFLLGEESHDIDVATNCPMEELRSMFRAHDITKKEAFEHLNFGVLLVELEGYLYEVAQFRTEKGYDGRRPSEVNFVQSLEEDVKRRDFTINAMAMDESGNVIDFVSGREDLEKKIVRAVGDPDRRFEEDYLRMLRAARFAAKTGFILDKATEQSIKRLAGNITKTSSERISMEITKAAKMSSVEFAKFIEVMAELGLLKLVLPEIDALRHLDHNPEFHPEGITVFDHVIEALKATKGDELVKIAVLLHDVGKSVTFSNEDGLPHYYRHEKVGEELAEAVMKRLKFPGFMVEPVVFAVSHHMLFLDMDKMRKAKTARIVSSIFFPLLVEVARADSKSRGAEWHDNEKFDKMVENFEKIRYQWEEFLGAKPLNIVSGDRIMELTGLKPCPTVGKIKKEVEEVIIERSIDPHDLTTVDEVVLEVYHAINKDVL